MPTPTPNSSSPDAPLLRVRGVSKAFPGVQALRDVGFELRSGEVLALVGENGAGKSTLIKVLAGAHTPDRGSITITGADVTGSSPRQVRERGIAVIHQETTLVPWLTAAENVYLGRELTRRGLIDRVSEQRAARSAFERIGIDVDPDAPCATLGVAERQAVEIAKALVADARVLILDEPTAALSPREVSGLFTIIRDLQDQGIGIIYVSHRLGEVRELADRIMVLRDGEHVITRSAAELDQNAMIQAMVGRPLDEEFPERARRPGEVRLEVRGLTRRPAVDAVSFEVRAGEIVALTGLVGAGRTEVARLVAGADPADDGTVLIDGEPTEIRDPRGAIRAGVALLTEDRAEQGLVLTHGLLENHGLPNLDRWSKRGVLDRTRERNSFAEYVERLGIRIHDPAQAAGTLSGGNQQKVVLSKWLARDSGVIIVDEPTRGIDVGARRDFYVLIDGLARSGKAVLMISSELPEVLGLADRVLVMCQGRLAGEITDVANTTQAQILELAIAP